MNTLMNEKALYHLYLSIKNIDPRPDDMSKSLYHTCLAIKICELMGNKFPTQGEVSSLEASLNRYSRRKFVLKSAA